MGLHEFIGMPYEPQGWHQEAEYPKQKKITYGLSLEYMDFFTPSEVFPSFLLDIPNFLKPQYPTADTSIDPDPSQKYEPSDKLVLLMIFNAIKLDKHISDKIKEFEDSFFENDDESEVKDDNLKAQISDRIEGLFSILARYNEGKKEQILISENDKLTIHFREQLQECLDLDNYDLKQVWDQLYEELSIFVSSPRDRVWGEITKDADGNIKLIIEPKKEFEIISPSDSDALT